MALIVGDLPAGVSVSSSLSATGFNRLLGELGASADSGRSADREAARHEPSRPEGGSSDAQQPSVSAPLQLSSSSAASGPPRPHAPSARKRKRDVDAGGTSRTPSIDAGQTTVGDAAVVDDEGERRRALSRSVEQSSNAAADMARGFQELLAVFQEQTARCRLLEQQTATPSAQTDAGTGALADQRNVVVAVAQSLEQSTRATAEMAQGYHELVKLYVLEMDLARQQRDGP
ncbi:hypothetical protein BBJ28_00019292 [Nothophytophthora sp. Chile5]|nr:hypothetical protein BBJ28_00019292 [Nothophytophthora sp. Chile5]